MDPRLRPTGRHFFLRPLDLERIRALKGDPRYEARVARAAKECEPWLRTPVPEYDARDDENTRCTIRHHSAMQDMAMLYLLTGEEKYAQACRRDLLTYVKVSKKHGGRLSGASLEEGVMKRSFLFVNEWLSEFFSDDERAAIRDMVIRTIPHHAHEMARFTLQGKVVQNHLQHDGTGLALAALYYNDFPQCARWAKLATDVCVQYAQEAFFPDGAQNELATSYHSGCVEEVVILGLLMRDFAGRDLFAEAWFREVLERGISWMGSLVTPGGGVVAFNDSRAATESWFFRLGASLFGNPHCQALADHIDERQQHEGHHPSLVFDLLFYDPGVPSRIDAGARTVFPHSTTVAFRDGFGREGGLLAQKAGRYTGGHAHPDRLNFEYWHQGAQLLRDLGGQRGGDWEIFRGFYRQSSSHTVVAIHEPQEFAFESKHKEREDTFRTEHRAHRLAQGRILQAADDDGAAHTVTQADIYDGVRQTRTLVWLKASGALVLRDAVESDEEHPFEQLFQGCGELGIAERAFAFAGRPWSLAASVLAPAEAQTIARKAPKETIGAPAYAAVAQRGKAVAFLTLLEPFQDKRPPVRALDAGGKLSFTAEGRAVQVQFDDGRLSVQLDDRTVFSDR